MVRVGRFLDEAERARRTGRGQPLDDLRRAGPVMASSYESHASSLDRRTFAVSGIRHPRRPTMASQQSSQRSARVVLAGQVPVEGSRDPVIGCDRDDRGQGWGIRRRDVDRDNPAQAVPEQDDGVFVDMLDETKHVLGLESSEGGRTVRGIAMPAKIGQQGSEAPGSIRGCSQQFMHPTEGVDA